MSTQEQKTDSNPFLGGHYLNLAKIGLMPPTEKYISAADKFYIAIWNSVTDLAVTMKGRMLLKNGSISEITRRFEPTDDRAINEYYLETPSGFLLDLEIFPEGSTKRGQTFVHVSLYQGADNPNNRNALLIQNYLTTGNALSYPRSNIQDSIEGQGVIRIITGTDPAAGAESSETVPTNARWRILAYNIALTTDATVSNRNVTVQLRDAVSEYWRHPWFDAHAASLIRAHYFAQNVGRLAAVSNNFFNGELPNVIMDEGHRIATVTTNLQAGDDFGAPTLIVEEWIQE